MSISVSPRQTEAWLLCNTSYHLPDGRPYRELGKELYRRALHDQIATLFERLDAQNNYLDLLLTARTPARRRPDKRPVETVQETSPRAA